MPTLLLADDSVAIQRLVELTFSHEDIDVTAVGDGEEAIARITANPPDLVLADIGMPKRSGYEVAAFVKQQPRFAKIPVLLLAGAFEPVDEARAAQVHCDGILVKPFEPQQVITRVRELLGGAVGTPVRAVAAVPRAVERLTRASAAPPPSLPAGDSLDDYFDRLDAAFATLDTAPTVARDEIETPIEAMPAAGESDLDVQAPIDHSLNQPLVEPDLDLDLPTVERLLSGNSRREAHRPDPDSPFAATKGGRAEAVRAPSTTPVTTAAADAPAAGRNTIADAFAALLAVEQGETPSHPVRLVASEPVITDALIEEVTRRVLERLASDKLRPVVADVVSSVAERLVREEIDRIRKA